MLTKIYLPLIVSFVFVPSESTNGVKTFRYIPPNSNPELDINNVVNDCVYRIEHNLNINEGLITLNKTIQQLQYIKSDILNDVKQHLSRIQVEIVTKNEQQITDIRYDFKNITEIIIERNGKQISEIEINLKNHIILEMLKQKLYIENEIKNELKKAFDKSQEQILDLQKIVEENKKKMADIEENTRNVQQLLHEREAKASNNIIHEREDKVTNKINNTNKIATPARECKELKRNGNNVSGIYKIRPEISSKEFQVWCDMNTRGGGWAYVVNRFDGSLNFDLDWDVYKRGFGDLSKEHWLGLEHLYLLTNSKENELLFELTDWDETTKYAAFDTFTIGNEEEGYSLKRLSGCSGDAGDSFSHHIGMKFSTRDREHDTHKTRNCAQRYESGWWYKDCYWCNVNGKRRIPPFTEDLVAKKAMNWKTFRGLNYSLKKAKMMVRPKY